MRDFDPTASEFISNGYLKHSRPGGLYFDPTTVMAGASLVNGIMGSDAASSAADAQRQATADSNARLERQYAQSRTDLAPWRSTGSNALERLAGLLGLSSGSSGGGANSSYDAIRAELAPQFTTQTPATGLFSSGVFDNGETWKAPPVSTVDEAGLNAAIQQRMQAQAAPVASTDPSFGSLLKPFTGQDLTSEPGYQFGLDQGQQALDRRAAAAGGYFSGAALKGATRYAQDYAGTKYQDAFNRDAANKDRTFNYLSGLSGSGQNAAAQTGTTGTQIASQVANNTSAMGNALGASAIAGGNAWSNAINGGINGYQQNQITQALLGGNRGFGGGSYSGMGPSPYAGDYSLNSSFNQYLR